MTEPKDIPGTRDFKVNNPERDLQPDTVTPDNSQRADAMHGEKFTGTEKTEYPGDQQPNPDIPGTRHFKVTHPEDDLTPGEMVAENRNLPDAHHNPTDDTPRDMKKLGDPTNTGGRRAGPGSDKPESDRDDDDDKRESAQKTKGAGYPNRMMQSDPAQGKPRRTR